MKKLMLLASAAVFVYAAFTQFRPGNNDDASQMDISLPVHMDLPLSMTVNGEAYAVNLSETYYDTYMRAVMSEQLIISE